jgi:hypothetical protein
VSPIYRCQRCRAYAHPRQLEWVAPRRYECKDTRRCLRGIRVHLFLIKVGNLEEKTWREQQIHRPG